MPEYRLINPHIVGNMKTSANTDSANEAAKSIWTRLSKVLSIDVPSLPITLEGGGKMHHFVVKELNKNGSVDFKIDAINVNTNSKQFKEFIEQNKSMQEGGRKKRSKKSKQSKKSKKYDEDEDDSEDDDEEDDFKDEEEAEMIYNRLMANRAFGPSTLIDYWFYSPYIYNTKSVFIPTFVAPLTPYIQLSIPYAPVL